MKNGRVLQLLQTHANKSGDIPYDWIFCAGIHIGPVLTVLYFVFDSTYAELFPPKSENFSTTFSALKLSQQCYLGT